MTAPVEWRKAEGSYATNCVELAALGGIAVRDSKNPGNPHLHFGRPAFAAFLNGLAAA